MDARTSALILEYLLAQGADEFTITVMAIQDTPAPFADAFEDALEPFSRANDIRPVLTESPDNALREVRLWALTRESLDELLRFHAAGLLATDVGPNGWLEDLIVYRRGELIFGVVSHEQTIVLRVANDERETLSNMGTDSLTFSSAS